ncbi:hypothetical protein T484DRAFT_2865394 [Baffinella frigidus]|nr:hypothetical protein T484DRAFT_2865394 [Cryptophyta sp. CCMP2293]
MDSRSAPQAAKILQLASQGPEDAGVKRSLAVNSGGKGPLSAEWMLPKSLWLKENDREVWDKAETVCEYQDYINLRLTGKLVASSYNVAARWHCHSFTRGSFLFSN